eukprot:gnl/Dysnectes_brevis/7168_a11765_409.p1 GENE.gnl/Dysnectes_brevis/7168_a11765_409~~gnl/Dysnectes_brevis/7168_a11765_409.p1  ORF type:complete len:200 (+),score=14.37 gnl/Dysnectes_brevis/7168_a11765_409:74-673(+)
MFPRDFESTWVNKPLKSEISDDRISITTEKDTDFWQNTYYHFQHTNAPALLYTVKDMPFFSLTVRVTSNPLKRFDQAGLIIFMDQQNWFKASTEYETPSLARMGSVVTTHGYSDWASCEIPGTPVHQIYRLSRRGSDFLLEVAKEGEPLRQLRIFHMHGLKPDEDVKIGVYACSPMDSSFEAVFDQFELGECLWEEHKV